MPNTVFDRELSRRRLLQLIGAAGVGAVTAGCAGPGSRGGDAAAPAPAPSTSGPVTGDVSFAHWRAEDKAVFDTIIADFASKNPGVRVTQDISPSNDYASTGLQKIRGGAIGDVFSAFRGVQFTNMASAGLFTDLSSQPFRGNYVTDLISSGQSSGKQLGFPYQLVFNMPVTNTDLLTQAGMTERPRDWDGFLALCEAIKGRGVVPISWPGGEAGNAGQLFNSMVMHNAPSEDMCAKLETGELKCTDDWFVQTLRQYAQLRPYFQPNATGTAVEPAQQIFATGKAAMLATGSYHIAAVRKLGAQFPIDLLSPVTVPRAQAKYEGVSNTTFIVGVNAESDNPAAGLAFVRHLSDPAVASVYANGTGQHLTVKGVDYTNADLKALTPWLERKTILAPRVQFNDLDIRGAVEGAATKVVGGADPQQAAEEAERVVAQRRK